MDDTLKVYFERLAELKREESELLENIAIFFTEDNEVDVMD